MTTKDFVEGLNLLLPYYDDPEGYCLGADHDIIYIYGTEKPLPKTTIKRLCELGFFQPEVDCEDDFQPVNYNPEEGWAVFV